MHTIGTNYNIDYNFTSAKFSKSIINQSVRPVRLYRLRVRGNIAQFQVSFWDFTKIIKKN